MKKYKLWIRISRTQSANTIVFAENDYLAKRLGETQYGIGNVLSYKIVK
jgi:hypothetical protein